MRIDVKNKFIHLHVHTQHSYLDGFCKTDELIEKAKKRGVDSIAITDHGNMSGVLEFYTKCKKNNIKPIIGLEIYLVDDRTKKDKDVAFKYNHLVLLAKNNKGYENLIKIASDSWLEGLYYRPRTDMSVLKKYNEGLIVLSSCIENRIVKYLLGDKVKKAVKEAKLYKKIWGKNFYIELEPHDFSELRKVNPLLVSISKKLKIPLVVANDTHYTDKKDFRAHNILLLIQTRKTLENVKQGEKVFQFKKSGFYIRNYKEMLRAFKRFQPDFYESNKKDILKGMKNTLKIAKQCSVEIPLGTYDLPSYTKNGNSTNIFKTLCNKGWKKKVEPYIGIKDKDNYKIDERKYVERFDFEYDSIIKLGLINYFLIIWDMMAYTRRAKIRTGSARGSVAGSLIAYLLGITKVDPIKFDLIFERFINPSRTGTGNIPDIDLDFQHDRREEVKEYLIKKWGQENVASIITFGIMAAKGTLKDVGRVYNLSFDYLNRITKYISWEDRSANLTMLKESDQNIQAFTRKHPDIFKIAERVEGRVRHFSTHAAGIVISNKKLIKYCPIQIRSLNDKTILTQWGMEDLSERGLLKIDILGLRTLTVLDDTIKLIYKNYGKKIILEDVSLTDKRIYKKFAEANTLGIFQFENRHFRELLEDIRPKTLYDLALINALGRPGAKRTGQHRLFVRRRQARTKNIKYAHPDLKKILGKTLGIITFQEQVMEICHKIGGISLAETNNIRESIKHFRHDVMASYGKRFVKHAVKKKNVKVKDAKELWEQCKAYSSYGFNLSHSVSYSLISYYCMWLRTYYSYEFLCAFLDSKSGDKNKLKYYLGETEDYGINVNREVDLFKSGLNFKIVENKRGEKVLLPGFVTVPGIGYKTAIKLVELRKKNKKKFIDNIPEGTKNKLMEVTNIP